MIALLPLETDWVKNTAILDARESTKSIERKDGRGASPQPHPARFLPRFTSFDLPLAITPVCMCVRLILSPLSSLLYITHLQSITW